MTVSTQPDYLATIFKSSVAMGDKAVNSDAYFEIVGHEDKSLLIKQFPWPELSVGDAIEVALPMGMNSAQPSQIKIYQQGAVSIYETVSGQAQDLFEKLIAQGGVFDAKVYEGTPDKFSRVCRIVKCFMVLDNPDRDWENRGQILMISGTLHFHYFGNQ